MGDAALAEAGATRLQAPNAHLPSRQSRRREEGPSTATPLAPLAGGQAARSASGYSGQPRQKHGRGGRRQNRSTYGPSRTGRLPDTQGQGQSGAASVHP